MAGSGSRGWPGSGRLAPLLVAGLALGLYANSIPNGFVLDDLWLVANNPLADDLGDWRTLLSSDYWAPRQRSGLYRPVATLSYAVNHATSGSQAWAFHGTNVALHALNSALVCLLFGQLGVGRLGATLGAALFAAHAVHTEAVANVAGGRPELLAAAFALAALFLHVARDRGELRGARASAAYALELLAYALALFSKESAVTLVGILVAYDVLLAQRSGSWRRRAAPYAGHLVVLALYGAARLTALGGHPLPPVPEIDNPLGALRFPWQQWSALYVAALYVWKLLFPWGLAYDYSYAQIPPIESFFDARSLLVIALLLGAVVAIDQAARRSPLLLFSLLFYGLAFSVVSNLVVPIGTILGERLLYLPSVGFCLAVALLPGVLAPNRRRIAVAALCVAIALHGARTLRRNLDWRSDETLHLHDVHVSPRSLKTQLNAGLAHSRRDEVDQAIAAYRESIRIRPNGGALNNLGYLLVDRGIDVEGGVDLLEQALALSGPSAELLDSLGWGYYKLGRLDEALRLLRRSLEFDSYGPTVEARRAHLREVEAARARRQGSERR